MSRNFYFSLLGIIGRVVFLLDLPCVCTAQEEAPPPPIEVTANEGEEKSRGIQELVWTAKTLQNRQDSSGQSQLFEVCNAIIADKEKFKSLPLEDQLWFLSVDLAVPMYWLRHPNLNNIGNAPASEELAKKHFDALLASAGEIQRARASLPARKPPHEFYNIGPFGDAEKRIVEQNDRNSEVANQIQRAEELTDRYASEAPSVLAGFLLFVNDAESLLKRMEKEPGITPEIVEATRKLLKERQERRKKSPVGK